VVPAVFLVARVSKVDLYIHTIVPVIPIAVPVGETLIECRAGEIDVALGLSNNSFNAGVVVHRIRSHLTVVVIVLIDALVRKSSDTLSICIKAMVHIRAVGLCLALLERYNF